MTRPAPDVVLSYDLKTSVNPLWWRIPVWAALIAASVFSSHYGDARRVAGGAVFVLGVVVFQFSDTGRLRLRQSIFLVAIACGLAGCLLLPSGLAEILVVIATGRTPRAFHGRGLIALVVIDTIAFSTVVAFISRSVAGALAGAAIPFLVQREIEHQELVRERDRAQALLAEVQAGRDAETQAAALRERGHIARELHDVLAHSLAGLSVQLQAVRTLAARERVPEPVLTQVDKAAALARDGLAEARSAVSALRDPIGLGLDELPSLVQRHPGAATLEVTGRPATVTPEAGHAVYRAVQEALTNAARYAPGSAVAVRLGRAPAKLRVTVTDTGAAPGRRAVAGQGTGLGLAGMTERITGAGGTLHTGPGPGGGWTVEIEIPAREAT